QGANAVKSKYACENKKLRLECQDPLTIRIYTAKFGRLESGNAICPHKNISNLNCQAPNTRDKMIERCAHRRKCTVRANSTYFGDPCPGTYKYLDVIYGCGENSSVIPRELISLTVWDPTKPTRTTSHATSVTKTIEATRSTSTFQTSLNTTSNSINVNISATRNWIARVTTRGSVTTASPPKPAKKPKDKASGSRGEKEGILSLLRSLYLTYRFIKDNPRDTLVVFLSVVAGGTIGLLSLLLTMYVAKSFRKKRKLAKERKKANQGKDGSKIKSVTIEIQGNEEETKEININPGDIIIIDHNDANQSGSEDLGYLSEIVRFYNSQNIGSDDQISIRKPLSSCDSPSVISTTESRDSKYDSSGINVKQCTCQQGPLLRPSSPVEEER
ncbi:unnamed protein product, partial [Porites lobata]